MNVHFDEKTPFLSGKETERSCSPRLRQGEQLLPHGGRTTTNLQDSISWRTGLLEIIDSLCPRQEDTNLWWIQGNANEV